VAEQAPAGGAARRGRAGRSPRDMALSMGVLLVPVLVLFILYNVLYNGDHPRGVDPAGDFAAARSAARFTVLQPAAAPPGWTAVSSTFRRQSDGSVLRVGYVTASRAGLQLIESDRPVNALLPEELGQAAQPGNLTTVGQRQWRAYPVARDGAMALVLAEESGTVIIIGNVPAADLRTLAATLR
jgi:Protein of unknown function (DUF4245)